MFRVRMYSRGSFKMLDDISITQLEEMYRLYGKHCVESSYRMEVYRVEPVPVQAIPA